MWGLGSSATVWLYRRPCDMRKSYDGLSGLARTRLGQNPVDGSVYCFVNRRRTQMKCLYFEDGGYCVWSKRLEQGSFQVRFEGDERARIDSSTLKLIVDGIDLQSVRRNKRYKHVRAPSNQVSLQSW